MDFIHAIEEVIGEKAKKVMMPMQQGDVQKTWAGVDDLIKVYYYEPNTPIKKGVQSFIHWYHQYNKV